MLNFHRDFLKNRLQIRANRENENIMQIPITAKTITMVKINQE